MVIEKRPETIKCLQISFTAVFVSLIMLFVISSQGVNVVDDNVKIIYENPLEKKFYANEQLTHSELEQLRVFWEESRRTGNIIDRSGGIDFWTSVQDVGLIIIWLPWSILIFLSKLTDFKIIPIILLLPFVLTIANIFSVNHFIEIGVTVFLMLYINLKRINPHALK